MNVWTQERTDAVALLWKQGLSASEIAARFDGLTRNAVIGKVSRMGLHRSTAPRMSRLGVRKSPWTPEAIKALTRMLDGGYTVPQIAVALGVTRAAVKKRMMRTGLRSKSIAAEMNKPRHKRQATWTVPRPAGLRAEPMAFAETVDRPPGAKPWTQRAFGECARPVWGVGADAHSCAKPTGGETYCGACRALMFVPNRPAQVRDIRRLWRVA